MIPKLERSPSKLERRLEIWNVRLFCRTHAAGTRRRSDRADEIVLERAPQIALNASNGCSHAMQ